MNTQGYGWMGGGGKHHLRYNIYSVKLYVGFCALAVDAAKHGLNTTTLSSKFSLHSNVAIQGEQGRRDERLL